LEGIDGDAMAINTYKLIRAAFAWGVREDLVDSNPAHDMKPRIEERLSDEERTLTDDELVEVWLGSESVGVAAAAYVRTMLLCGTRRTETALAEWSHLDLEPKDDRGDPKPTWTIPPENRKGRAGKKRGLVVPLSAQAAGVFKGLQRTARDSRWIFASDSGANISANFGRLGSTLKKAAGVEFGFHDLRATCATGAGRLGAPPYVIALLLGHQGVPGTPDVTSRYDRADRLPEVRLALDKWGTYVDELVTRRASARSASRTGDESRSGPSHLGLAAGPGSGTLIPC
jgi:integrase